MVSVRLYYLFLARVLYSKVIDGTKRLCCYIHLDPVFGDQGALPTQQKVRMQSISIKKLMLPPFLIVEPDRHML